MPTATTYSSLLSDIRVYIERAFTSASDPLVYEQLPRLVNAGERRVARELKILGFQQAYQFTLAAGVFEYDKPAGWRSTTSIGIATGADLDSYDPLFPRSYEYCRSYWPRVTQERGVPKYYADYDFYRWLIVPTPVAAYPAEVLVWQQPQLLDVANQSNWLTDEAPDLLKYAVLMEASPLLKNDEALGRWKGFYSDAMASTNGEDLQRVIDRTQKRSTS